MLACRSTYAHRHGTQTGAQPVLLDAILGQRARKTPIPDLFVELNRTTKVAEVGRVLCCLLVALIGGTLRDEKVSVSRKR